MPPHNALVTATYSRRMRLAAADRRKRGRRANQGKRLRPVCGDRVIAEPITREKPTGSSSDILPSRQRAYPARTCAGRSEVLAANVDQACWSWPPPRRRRTGRSSIAICARPNHAGDGAAVDFQQDRPAGRRNVGLCRTRRIPPASATRRCACSAKHRRRYRPAWQCPAGETAIIVGQSGVGKSSIINRLTGRELRTASTVGQDSRNRPPHDGQLRNAAATGRRLGDRLAGRPRLCPGAAFAAVRGGVGFRGDCRCAAGMPIRELPSSRGAGLCRQAGSARRRDQRTPLHKLLQACSS